MNFAQIVAKVKSEGGFDVTDDMVGGWVNEVYKEAVAASEWMVATVELGPVEDGVSAYAIPDNVVGVDAIHVDGSSSYYRVGTSDLWSLQAGDSSIFPTSHSVFAQNFDADGQRQIELWPVPEAEDAGASIMARVALVPTDLTGEAEPQVPQDVHGRLVDGAVAIGLQRIDERPGAAQVFDAKFAEIVTALRGRKRSQVPGEGSRLQVEYHDF
jgi:hypothetical protein